MKKVGLLVLILVSILGFYFGNISLASEEPSLQLALSADTPGSRDIMIGSRDVVALKFNLTASYLADIQVNSLRVRVFRIPIENGIITGEASPAQPGDIANVRLDMEPDFQLTLSKDFDAGSNSVTFSGRDWLSPMTVLRGTRQTLSVVFNVPETCNASGLFFTIEGQDVKITFSSEGQTYQANAIGSANGTIMVIKKSGYISFSLPPDTPQSAILAVGETGADNVTLTKIDFFAGRESVAIQSLGIANMAKSIRDTDIKAVSLWDENTQLGTKQVFPSNTNETWFNFPPDSPWIIPANTHKILTIKADLNGIASGSVSGDTVALALDPSVKAVGMFSGKILAGASNWIFGNTMVLRKSKPVITAASLPSTVLSAGEKILYRWTVTADQKGDIGWKLVTFELSGSIHIGAEEFTIGSVAEIQSADAVYMQSSNGGKLKKLIPLESLGVFNVQGKKISGAIEIYNLPDRALVRFIVAGNKTIATGGTDTYELRGFILHGGKDDDAIMTHIPDSSTIPDNEYIIDGETFAWNDGVAWANEYLVPGIPTAILTLNKNRVGEEIKWNYPQPPIISPNPQTRRGDWEEKR